MFEMKERQPNSNEASFTIVVSSSSCFLYVTHFIHACNFEMLVFYYYFYYYDYVDKMEIIFSFLVLMFIKFHLYHELSKIHMYHELSKIDFYFLVLILLMFC